MNVYVHYTHVPAVAKLYMYSCSVFVARDGACNMVSLPLTRVPWCAPLTRFTVRIRTNLHQTLMCLSLTLIINDGQVTSFSQQPPPDLVNATCLI